MAKPRQILDDIANAAAILGIDGIDRERQIPIQHDDRHSGFLDQIVDRGLGLIGNDGNDAVDRILLR